MRVSSQLDVLICAPGTQGCSLVPQRAAAARSMTPGLDQWVVYGLPYCPALGRLEIQRVQGKQHVWLQPASGATEGSALSRWTREHGPLDSVVCHASQRLAHEAAWTLAGPTLLTDCTMHAMPPWHPPVSKGSAAAAPCALGLATGPTQVCHVQVRVACCLRLL